VERSITAVLWDFNGAIIADTQAVYEAAAETVRKFGGRDLTLAEYRATIGVPFLQCYSGYGCDFEDITARAEEFAHTFHDAYEPRAKRVRTRRGVRQALKFLRSNLIPSAIFSNHTEEGVTAQLRRLRIADMFVDVLANNSRSEVLHKRSKKEKVAAYLTQKGLDPSTVVIIGDTVEETEIAHELGLVSVAITGGNHSTDRLRKVRPNHLIGNVADLIRIVQKHN
jgi:phosphoglycolate phosphatase